MPGRTESFNLDDMNDRRRAVVGCSSEHQRITSSIPLSEQDKDKLKKETTPILGGEIMNYLLTVLKSLGDKLPGNSRSGSN